MSQTFTLKARTSCLSADFYPPIELDPNSEYSLALIGLHTYNTIPNIEKGENKFYYSDGMKNKVVKLPTGAYEISDIETYLQKALSDPNAEEDELNDTLSIKPNNNTLKCEIKSIFEIDFKPRDSIGRILGFSERYLPPGIIHESDLTVDIVKVATIRIECNIISGSYYGSKLSHTLYEFSPSVNPGYSITIEPSNLIYLPVNQKTISNITIELLSQNSKLINFQGEEIIVRLHLKKNN